MRPTSDDGSQSAAAFPPCPTPKDTMPLFRKPRSPYWWYSISFQGRRYRASTEKTTKSAAAQVEAEALNRLSRGEQIRRGATLREFSVRFLEWVSQTSELQPSSRRYYQYGWRLLELSPLAPRRMDTITADEISCVTFAQSVSYTLQALRTLKVMLGKAVDWDVIYKRPRVPMPRAVGRTTLIDPRTDVALEAAFLAPHENKGVMRSRRRAWTVVVCVNDGGMRPNEVFPMRIEHVDFERRRIWVPEGKTPNAKRWVAMSERMAALLKEQRGESGYVFPVGKGHLTSIAKSFQEARRRAGLPKSVVLYSGRHTFGTFAMEKTGNIFAVSKAMGHGSIRSMEPYQHPNPDLDLLSEVINQRNAARHTFGHTASLVN